MDDKDRLCDGCECLSFAYERKIYSAHCCDPEKTAFGSTRTLAVSRVCVPSGILRPAWCRGKQENRYGQK